MYSLVSGGVKAASRVNCGDRRSLHRREVTVLGACD